MVHTEKKQLTTEAAEWRQILYNYKSEFTDCQQALEGLCKLKLSKDQMLAVEHFQNLFQIHLVNIHDMKQRIKRHERMFIAELSNGALANVSAQAHQELLQDFIVLENALQHLRDDFSSFLETTG